MSTFAFVFIGTYLVGVFVAYGLLYGSSEKSFHAIKNFGLSILFSLTSWIAIVALIANPVGFGQGLGFKLIPDFSSDSLYD